MTRRASTAQLELALTPPAPASGPRTVAHKGPFRFVWIHRGVEVTVDVPRRHEGQGEWPNGIPRMVEQSDAARDRAIALHAARVAAATPKGARDGATLTGAPEHPRVDAARVRALLVTGPRDHHEVAAALAVTPEVAAGVLTHPRNTGHVHRAETRATKRRAGRGGPNSIGVWELTVKGRARAMRETGGKTKTSSWNDAGYRSTERGAAR